MNPLAHLSAQELRERERAAYADGNVSLANLLALAADHASDLDADEQAYEDGHRDGVREGYEDGYADGQADRGHRDD